MSGFTWIDMVVLVVYLGAVLLAGLAFSKKEMKGKEFFDKAFFFCFIYNRRKMVCQEQAKIPLVEETLNALLDYKPNSL